jgi:hypothetical protein
MPNDDRPVQNTQPLPWTVGDMRNELITLYMSYDRRINEARDYQMVCKLIERRRAEETALMERHGVYDNEAELEAHATDRVNQRKELQAAREECDRLRKLLRDCVDGLGCQPGYVKSLTLQRMQAELALAPLSEEHTADEPARKPKP